MPYAGHPIEPDYSENSKPTQISYSFSFVHLRQFWQTHAQVSI